MQALIPEALRSLDSLRLSAYVQNQLRCHQSAVSLGRWWTVLAKIQLIRAGVVDLLLGGVAK